jgi:hypothetical protein
VQAKQSSEVGIIYCVEQQNDETKRDFTDRYASGLKASVHNNSIAYSSIR